MPKSKEQYKAEMAELLGVKSVESLDKETTEDGDISDYEFFIKMQKKYKISNVPGMYAFYEKQYDYYSKLFDDAQQKSRQERLEGKPIEVDELGDVILSQSQRDMGRYGQKLDELRRYKEVFFKVYPTSTMVLQSDHDWNDSFDEYVQAKDDYNALNGWQKMWAHLLPSSWYGKAELVDKINGYKAAMKDCGFDDLEIKDSEMLNRGYQIDGNEKGSKRYIKPVEIEDDDESEVDLEDALNMNPQREERLDGEELENEQEKFEDKKLSSGHILVNEEYEQEFDNFVDYSQLGKETDMTGGNMPKSNKIEENKSLGKNGPEFGNNGDRK